MFENFRIFFENFKGGWSVNFKLFMGEDFEGVKNLAKKILKSQLYKPSSSRGESKETYIHCRGINAL